ncbi:MAG: hypothetical protein J0H00_09165 [Burkholderiales bacterium]|nr:hypothetical protein [Burkholderiales bacterium]OJX06757.1 MAG: hypothetical protein BGO72_00205 [Burkholderiales bacterium 70-64]
MDAARRHRWLMLCLAATLGTSAWTYRHQDRDRVEIAGALPGASRVAAAAPAAAAPVPQPPESAALELVPRADSEAQARHASRDADPFAVTTWQPPVPAPPPPAPPPPPAVAAPVAPPLPFRYLGRQETAGGPREATEFYLARAGEGLAVRAGEKLGEDYLFEGEDDQGALQFIYLPLSAKQALLVGEGR